MTGIAHGLSNIANLSKGNTPILKVSLGNTLVYPSGGGAFAQLKVVGSANIFSGSTMALPAGTKAGDLIVLSQVGRNSSGAPTAPTPTGFTVIQSVINSADGGTAQMAYRVQGASLADVTNLIVGNAQNYKVITAYRGYAADGVTEAPFTSVALIANNGAIWANTAAGAGDYSTNLIAGKTLIIESAACGIGASENVQDHAFMFQDFTPGQDAAYGSTQPTKMQTLDKVYQTGGTVSCTMSDSGSFNALQSVQLNVS